MDEDDAVLVLRLEDCALEEDETVLVSSLAPQTTLLTAGPTEDLR